MRRRNGIVINEKRLLDLFVRLVKTNSPSKGERGVADILLPILRDLGFYVEEDDAGSKIGGDAGNLIAFKEGRSDVGRRIFLSSHMDTVQPTDGLEPQIVDGVIRSNGNSVLGADDKAGIAAIIEAMRVIDEQKVPFRSIQVLFDVSEEVGLLGAKNLTKDKIKADFGYVFDAELPVGSIVVAAPSHENIRVNYTGKAAHAGVAPEAGISAIQAAAKAIAKMQLGRIDFETTANVGIIRGGQARNIIPEEVEVLGEARSRNEEKLARQVQHMVQCFHDAAQETGADVEIEVVREYDAYRFSADDPVVQMAAEAGRRIGVRTELAEHGGGSDANVFNSRGLPAVVVGVGYKDAHTSDERIAIDELMNCARFAVALVEVSTRF